MEPFPFFDPDNAYRHEDNLSVWGPTPLEANQIRGEYIFDGITISSTIAATAICSALEVGWVVPLTVRTAESGAFVEAAGIGVFGLIVGGIALGTHSITRSTRRHMQQLRMNRQFMAVLQREGLLDDTNNS